MNEHLKNNRVKLVGDIASKYEYSHEVFGEKFYRIMLQVNRKSEAKDIIPVIVSERFYERGNHIGKKVVVHGQLRSFNKMEEGRTRLVLSVFARDICFAEPEEEHYNSIILDGYIVKQPTYRLTPQEKEITDLLLAVNRQYGKSDYIPTICWGRNAKWAGNLNVGTRLEVHGRIQSREYQKLVGQDQFETRVCYEVSIGKMSLFGEKE